VSAEPQAAFSFHKLNTMRMRAYTLATTKLDGCTYNLVAGFGVTEHDGDKLLDTAAALHVRVFIANNYGKATAAARPEVVWSKRDQGCLCVMHKECGSLGQARDLHLVKVPIRRDRAIIHACLASLRSCVGRDYNALAGYLVYCVDMSDVNDGTFAEHTNRKIAEADRGMELLPNMEVSYSTDYQGVTFNLGRVWFPSQDVQHVR
jgi:hypothetical protein